MPARYFQNLSVHICLDTVLRESVLLYIGEMTAVIIMVFCSVYVCHVIVEILVASEAVCGFYAFRQTVLMVPGSVKRNDATVRRLEIYICIVCVKHVVQGVCPFFPHLFVMAAAL